MFQRGSKFYSKISSGGSIFFEKLVPGGTNFGGSIFAVTALAHQKNQNNNNMNKCWFSNLPMWYFIDTVYLL